MLVQAGDNSLQEQRGSIIIACKVSFSKKKGCAGSLVLSPLPSTVNVCQRANRNKSWDQPACSAVAAPGSAASLYTKGFPLRLGLNTVHGYKPVSIKRLHLYFLVLRVRLQVLGFSRAADRRLPALLQQPLSYSGHRTVIPS